MNQSDFYIHIGYHKTGTTFLQKQVFPALSANRIIMPDVSYIATSDQFDPDHCKQLLQTQAQSIRHPRTIISQETLSGRSDGNPIWDPHRIAKRLCMTFPNAKILIVIRNQFDYILSLYAFRVVRRGLEYRTLDEFLTLKQDHLAAKLQYDRLIGDYVRLFGRDQVLVLPYEALAADAPAFVQQVLTFFGCTQPIPLSPQWENVSTRNGRLLQTSRLLNTPVSILLTQLLKKRLVSQSHHDRIANLYFRAKKQILNPIGEKVFCHTNSTIAIPDKWQEILFPIFAVSNRRLSNQIQIELKKWMYPLSIK